MRRTSSSSRSAIVWMRLALFTATGLVVGGGRAAFAQDTPANTSANTSANTRSIVFGIRNQTSYEQNPLFVLDGPEDISTQVSGTGSLVLTHDRNSLAVGGQLDRSFYRRIEQLNRFTYAGNGVAHYGVTPRLNLQAAAAYATLVVSGETVDASGGVSGGGVSGGGVSGGGVSGGGVSGGTPGTIAPPVATTNSVAIPSTIYHTLSTAGSASYAVSERTAAQVQASYNQVRFDTAGVPDGSTFSTGGTFQHRYSERSSVGMVYLYQSNDGVGQSGTIHSALGSWGSNHDRIDVALQLGVLANATKGEDRWIEPGGSAQLRYRLSRGAIDLRFDRSAAQAFGVGRILLTNQASAGLTQTLGRFGFHAGASASRGHDSEFKTYKLHMYAAEMGLERPLFSTVKLMASAYYRRRSEFVSTNDRGVRMLLTYDGRYF